MFPEVEVEAEQPAPPAPAPDPPAVPLPDPPAGPPRDREPPGESIVVEEPPEPIGAEQPVEVDQLPDIVEPREHLDVRGYLGLRRFLGAAARWAVLAGAAGVAAGLGASLFIAGLNWLTGTVNSARAALPWYLIVVFPAIGATAVGYLLWRTDRVAFVSACGTDSFIDAVGEANGRISPKVPLLRILGAWLTIGFGGSSGRECPMIYTGAGLGSTVGGALQALRSRLRGNQPGDGGNQPGDEAERTEPRVAAWRCALARILDLSPADTRMLALCGAAGALGAVFSAPFGGAIFAVEVPYRRDINMGFFWPALVSSFTGYAVGYLAVGRQRLLHVPSLHALSGREWALVVVLAVAASLVGRLFAGVFNGLHGLFRRLFREEGGRLPKWVQTGIGGLLAGLVMLAFPQVYGIGYQAIRDTAAGHLYAGHAMAATALLFVGLGLGKILASSFTVGSGGVGGLLFPTMFTGAALGGVASAVASALWPGQFPHTAAYVVIAMGATYAAAGKVPLASLLLLCEATANFSLAVPMAAANGLAYLLSGRSTVYDVQRERSEGDHRRGYLVAIAFLVVIVLIGRYVVAI
ncbi:MAG: chloride channel protein [Acidimicrobiales bacterium]